jgi:hypothetical protein
MVEQSQKCKVRKRVKNLKLKEKAWMLEPNNIWSLIDWEKKEVHGSLWSCGGKKRRELLVIGVNKPLNPSHLIPSHLLVMPNPSGNLVVLALRKRTRCFQKTLSIYF